MALIICPFAFCSNEIWVLIKIHGKISHKHAQYCFCLLNMKTEIEAKFPDIDPVALRLKLSEIGAIRAHAEILMRRKTFDFADKKLWGKKGWVRIRDEGDKVTMSYKQLDDRTINGTKEVSLVVDDFDTAGDFLESIGLENKSYQETKREKWVYEPKLPAKSSRKVAESGKQNRSEAVEITVDTWPWVPTFVELEGPTEDSIKQAAIALGLDWSKAMHGSVETIYQMHYDVTEKEIDYWPNITFVPTPEWLIATRKTKREN